METLKNIKVLVVVGVLVVAGISYAIFSQKPSDVVALNTQSQSEDKKIVTTQETPTTVIREKTSVDTNENKPAPTPTTVTTPDTLEKTSYTNTKGFKINSPKGWKIDESGTMGTLAILYNPIVDKEGDAPFAANINVSSESATGMDLNTYVNGSKDAMANVLTNYKITQEKNVTIGGVQAKILEATFVQGSFHLRNLQLVIIKNNQAYVVTGSALESTWSRYKDVFEASLMTFSLN